jgi:hypothetical protein
LGPEVARADELPRLTLSAHCSGVTQTIQLGTVMLNVAGSCTFARGDVAIFGSARLANQPDGNLVVYSTETGRAAWATGTVGFFDDRLVYQGGELIYFDSSGNPLWRSWTAGQCTDVNQYKTLTFQLDNNVVIYCRNRADNAILSVLWTTGTQRR